MSGLLEKKYISFLSTRLTRFKWVRDTVAVCKCTFCGDGEKGRGTRMYFYQDNRHGTGLYFVECKNCGISMSFASYMKDSDKSMYDEYKLEVFIEKNGREPYKKKEPVSKVIISSSFIKSDVIEKPPYSVSVSILPADHICKKYVMGRMIPEQFYTRLFYTADFNKLVSLFIDEEYAKRIPKDKRLVIPFYDEFGKLFMLQGRSLEENSKIRYVTIKKDENSNKVFGLERIDRSQPVTIVEGPLDSLFINNCLASADGNLLKVKGDIYANDFQYRNYDICHNIDRIIESGNKIVLLDKDFPFKDINDMIVAGFTQEEVMNILNRNTYSGLKAKLRFTQLKGTQKHGRK